MSTPPSLNYESDGGPGIQRIARLLAGSDDPTADQAALLKANVVFWLLGAIDGHAKNFSVFFRPGGRFGLTPLYDVLSAQPAADAGQLRWSRFKLSMAVGTNRHCTINSVAPRHFVQTALRAGIGASVVEAIFENVLSRAPMVFNEVLAKLPGNFPEALLRTVGTAALRRLRLLEHPRALAQRFAHPLKAIGDP